MRRRLAWLGALAWAALAAPLMAQAQPEPGPAFKFTAGRYASSDGNPALDLNLRATLGVHTGWLGVYRDRAGLQQWRSGYEFRTDGELLRNVWSLQNASGGAWVGAVTGEIGGDSYALLGFGRTNGRSYINLNYDPNDAITWGLGTRAIAGTELDLFQVFDDRLHTGQRITHALWRQHLDGEQRLTLDLSVKRGLTAEGDFVRGSGWTLGYDRGPLFMRYAYDPHAGFAAPTQHRLSLGTRF